MKNGWGIYLKGNWVFNLPYQRNKSRLIRVLSRDRGSVQNKVISTIGYIHASRSFSIPVSFSIIGSENLKPPTIVYFQSETFQAQSCHMEHFVDAIFVGSKYIIRRKNI